MVAGVRKDGYRVILGATIVDAENELFWEDYFEELKERGLKGVELIISDRHKGIISAAEKAFPGSSWQMCHVVCQEGKEENFSFEPCLVRDEGRPLEAVMQVKASNHRKLLW